MARLGLCVQLSEEHEADANLARMEAMAREARRRGLDAIFFGEAYLQGFDSLAFNPEQDRKVATGLSGPPAAAVRAMAIRYQLYIGFGFYELDGDSIYATYLVVDPAGRDLCRYRRISPGWRVPDAPACYQDGNTLVSFPLKEKTIGLMVCGDFWTDSLLADLRSLDSRVDAMLWPVHCDYPLAAWEEGIKDEYRERTRLLSKPVLYVNNLHQAFDRAKGGAYCWHQGETIAQMPAGRAGMLEVQL